MGTPPTTNDHTGPVAPYLIALVVLATLSVAGIGWVFSLGGTETVGRVAAIGAVTGPIILMLINVIQNKAMEARFVAQAQATVAAVKAQHAETQATVAAVEVKIDQVAEQTDGKLTELLNATKGQAKAEGELKGAALERDTAAREAQERATAAALLASQAPASVALPAATPTLVEVSNPSVPVHLTEAEADIIANKVTDRATGTEENEAKRVAAIANSEHRKADD